MAQIITLTTDFGLEDEYVGVMKGVILSRAPGARIVDLTHGIKAQDVRQAAFVIHSASQYFPQGTVHTVVVDPGVGGQRKIILLTAGNQLFLAPDNGVLSLVLQRDSRIYEATNNSLFPPSVSRTFHGRDIFAPLAAALVNGLDPAKVGPGLTDKEITLLPLSEVRISEREVVGSVIAIDHFGNLITNIHRSMLPGDLSRVSVKIGTLVAGVRACYEDVSEAGLLALFGSRDCLEIAVNCGNAAMLLESSIDDEIVVTW
ncbi:MAG: SAM-dependent chlorinase/fluorinase [Thermodesulfobacteriota bacterium]|nr:SAM-dependent chlorinase/fluorinase [Thermodesulfobacteriota bacterium]